MPSSNLRLPDVIRHMSRPRDFDMGKAGASLPALLLSANCYRPSIFLLMKATTSAVSVAVRRDRRFDNAATTERGEPSEIPDIPVVFRQHLVERRLQP